MPILVAGDREFNCDAVLLDKDGTLFDFKAMWLAWSGYVIDELLAKLNHLVPRQALEQAMGIDLDSWYVDPHGPLAGGTMTGLRSAIVQVLQKAGMVSDQAGRLVNEVYSQSETAMDWESLTRPVPGLREKLENLKCSGFKLAVVTADITQRSIVSLTSLKLAGYFDTVIGADLVRSTKPAPDMALLACRLLGTEPAQAVVVGDTPRDIHMARNAGAGSIGVLSGVCTREQLAEADVVVHSVIALG